MTQNSKFEMSLVGDRSESMSSMENTPWKGVRDWANDQAIEAQKIIMMRALLLSFLMMSRHAY